MANQNTGEGILWSDRLLVNFTECILLNCSVSQNMTNLKGASISCVEWMCLLRFTITKTNVSRKIQSSMMWKSIIQLCTWTSSLLMIHKIESALKWQCVTLPEALATDMKWQDWSNARTDAIYHRKNIRRICTAAHRSCDEKCLRSLLPAIKQKNSTWTGSLGGTEISAWWDEASSLYLSASI